MATIHLNKEGFKKTIASDGVTMVDFWAPWCGPCKMLGPVIDDIAKRYEGKAIIGKLNVDDEQSVAASYGVMTIPTVIFFKGGKEIERRVGATPPETFTDILDANL